ncbi:hypothetical protein GA0070616_1288 [Micromonospora nigra]|uniref:Uncharacterized protein n=1 Tax=Micromonospora nigra TaxID=145857 RepID=A0A1C6RJX3_9ACTN|nr:hypothetical protein [Micromonospora nigra]SCL17489.1 hypothetical protein GA0070616_1288 [Micromonospora nigra]
MSGASRGTWATVPVEEQWHRPLYARLLGLRFVNPGGVLCFVFFEGSVALAALLALAELVTWWAVLVLPAAVAVMVKLNDLVAATVIRSAAAVPEQERDRFRRQIEPVVGRARVDWLRHSVPGEVVTAEAGPADRPTTGPGHAELRAGNPHLWGGTPSGGPTWSAGHHADPPAPSRRRTARRPEW